MNTMKRYKFAYAIRKYAGKSEENKEILSKAHNAALGIAVGLPIGTTSVGALTGAGSGYILSKLFKRDPKKWAIGGGLLGGGVGFGMAAPFSTLGVMGAKASNDMKKKIERNERNAKKKKC